MGRGVLCVCVMAWRYGESERGRNDNCFPSDISRIRKFEVAISR